MRITTPPQTLVAVFGANNVLNHELLSSLVVENETAELKIESHGRSCKRNHRTEILLEWWSESG